MTRSTWGLALDAAHARIVPDLERPPGGPPPEEVRLDFEVPRLTDLMSDKPGRSYASVGSARSAMEYGSDPVLAAECVFCDDVLARLDAGLAAGDFDRLVVAAAPRMLGLLRDRRSEAVAEATVAEVAKDFLKLAPKELRERLRDLAPSRLE